MILLIKNKLLLCKQIGVYFRVIYKVGKGIAFGHCIPRGKTVHIDGNGNGNSGGTQQTTGASLYMAALVRHSFKYS